MSIHCYPTCPLCQQQFEPHYITASLRDLGLWVGQEILARHLQECDGFNTLFKIKQLPGTDSNRAFFTWEIGDPNSIDLLVDELIKKLIELRERASLEG